MNGAISVTTDETKADKYAANCVLALPLVGSNTDVCDQINCTTSAKTGLSTLMLLLRERQAISQKVLSLMVLGTTWGQHQTQILRWERRFYS